MNTKIRNWGLFFLVLLILGIGATPYANTVDFFIRAAIMVPLILVLSVIAVQQWWKDQHDPHRVHSQLNFLERSLRRLRKWAHGEEDR
jgi:hypothetical protein